MNMNKLQNEKAANEKTVRLEHAGQNKATCDGDTIVGYDGEGQPQRADEKVRMGRVVTNKTTSGCGTEKDATCRV
jgi:hypothetical protein